MKKQRKASGPIEEFYIIAAKDVASGDLADLRDACCWYPDGDSAILEAAVEAHYDDDNEGFPQVVYRVQKYVEIK